MATYELRIPISFDGSVAALLTVGVAWVGHLPAARLFTGLAIVTLANAAFTFWQTRAANLQLHQSGARTKSSA